MKRFAVFVTMLMLMIAPANAAEITLKLSDQEQQQLLALLDLAAKQGGLNAAGAVNYFAQKIQQPKPSPPAPSEDNKP